MTEQRCAPTSKNSYITHQTQGKDQKDYRNPYQPKREPVNIYPPYTSSPTQREPVPSCYTGPNTAPFQMNPAPSLASILEKMNKMEMEIKFLANKLDKQEAITEKHEKALSSSNEKDPLLEFSWENPTRPRDSPLQMNPPSTTDAISIPRSSSSVVPPSEEFIEKGRDIKKRLETIAEVINALRDVGHSSFGRETGNLTEIKTAYDLKLVTYLYCPSKNLEKELEVLYNNFRNTADNISNI
jgi:hypothetical protein